MLFCDLSNYPARVSSSEYSVRHVPRDHAPSTNNGLRADLHARADNRPAADPHIRPDLDWLGKLLLPAQFSFHGMSGGVNLDRRAEQGEVPDLRSEAHTS